MSGRLLGAAALLVLAACTTRNKSSLGESLAIEQPGGTVAQLMAQGSELPASATESFTNGREDETKLYVHVLRGPGRTADKLHSDGWWAVDGVAPSKPGQARVMVTFELDGQGALKISAREEDKKLPVHKLEALNEKKPHAAPLTEPDDGADLDPDVE